MDPQWNMFQPPNSESAVLDYNRSYSVPYSNPYSSQNHSRYNERGQINGFYDSSLNSFQQNKMMSSSSSSSSSLLSNDYSNYSSFYSNTSSSQSSLNQSSLNQSSRTQLPSQSSHGTPSQSSYYSSNNSLSSQYTPPISDFKIGTFTLNANGYPSESTSQDSWSNNVSTQNSNSNSYQQNNSSAANQSVRETGIIEKLLQTYGFIQCCERQARLFFHFSQFEGNTEHLRIGDPVEFEVTFDRRTGKPIASSVTKISPDVVLSEERVIGIVTTELKSESSGEQQGRITYENRGECFFLPYGKEDVEGYVTLKPGDKVSFQIATNQRTGNLAARHVRLENPVEPVKYQGVVSAIKDSYGFIERADVVDEIFFHFSEAKTIADGLKLGDDVEFLIQTRNGKEVATNMVKLTPGTVVFEDINIEEMRGQVLKPVEKTLRQNQKDPLTGRIRYRGKDRSEVEVKFGERDQKGDFTLRHGDWVKFNIATDRRDRLQKATNISLLDESFDVSGEKREQGIVCILKEGFGFIKCAEREARMYFPYNELLDPLKEIRLDEEVEFTVAADQNNQFPNNQGAIRIRRLPLGSVKFEMLVREKLQGEVTRESTFIACSPTKMSSSDKKAQPGLISFESEGIFQTIVFYGEEEKNPQLGDRVEFDLYLVKRNKERISRNVRVIPPTITAITPTCITSRQSLVGSGRTFDRGSTSTSTMPITMAPNNIPQNNFTVVRSLPSTSMPPPPPPPSVPASTSANQTPSTIQSSEPKPAQNLDLPVPSVSPASSQVPTQPQRTGHLSKSLPPIQYGYIAALKESYGFIETINHDKEIFFHFSNAQQNNLELGAEVEYTISQRRSSEGKISAENVKVLPIGSLPQPKVMGEVFEGTVLRSLRSFNPEQQEYCGLVCIQKEDDKLGRHQFGITGLANKKECLQPGDQVTFQLDENGFAVNINAVRKKLTATVETVKGLYGFLNYDIDDGKSLFFHQSEVKDDVELKAGDKVEFVIVTNQKTGKSSACNITRVATSNPSSSQRPEHLINRMRNLKLDTQKLRIQVIRQPKGPDGTKGFKVRRHHITQNGDD